MKDWKEEFESKMITAEQAAQLVRSGDRVSFTLGREAFSIGLALAARIGDLQGVKVFQPFPGYDFGWCDPGWEEFFQITLLMPTHAKLIHQNANESSQMNCAMISKASIQ